MWIGLYCCCFYFPYTKYSWAECMVLNCLIRSRLYVEHNQEGQCDRISFEARVVTIMDQTRSNSWISLTSLLASALSESVEFSICYKRRVTINVSFNVINASPTKQLSEFSSVLKTYIATVPDIITYFNNGALNQIRLLTVGVPDSSK